VLAAVCSCLALFVTAQPTVAVGAPAHRVTGPAGASPRRDALSDALGAGRISWATYALERARSLFDLVGVRRRYGDVARTSSADATLVLRDLRIAYDDLSPSQRRIADALLARPTDGAKDPYGFGYAVHEAKPDCNRHACFHWVRRTADAPAPADDDANGRPDFVDDVVATLNTVWHTEIGNFGFRKPKSDRTSRNHGPNGKIDIYLADIGDQAFYGYCASDDPHDFGGRYPYWDASAYCVVDDDFSASQFPGANGIAALRVTLAHEFFHAIQFAYDYFEDRWFMEATAAWIEDEVYDGVDDNVQYLPDSPLAVPSRPLDDNRTPFGVYGDWIFFRFLSELFGSAANHDVAVVRRAWELADGSRDGPDRYSLKAVAIASKRSGGPFRPTFARFGAVNDVAPRWYEEGTENAYPLPPSRAVTLAPSDSDTNVYSMKHLTNRYVRFTPDPGLGATAELVLRLDLPDPETGSAATAVVFPTTGDATFARAALNRRGNATLRLPFDHATTARIDLVLSNASTRTRCWRSLRSRYSCYGRPTDDGLPYEYTATVAA
jgi:hypothetical protein